MPEGLAWFYQTWQLIYVLRAVKTSSLNSDAFDFFTELEWPDFLEGFL